MWGSRLPILAVALILHIGEFPGVPMDDDIQASGSGVTGPKIEEVDYPSDT